MGKWFFVGVECVNQILGPDIAVSRAIVEFLSIQDLLACFVRGGVVDDDDTVTAPFGVAGLLKKIKAFSVELVIVPFLVCEEFVQCALTFGR